MEAQDFKQEDDDLVIVNGDFLTDFSSEQHIVDIVNSHKGFYKQFPMVGVGLSNYLKSAGLQQELKTEIRIQLQADNFIINAIEVGDLEKMEVYIDAIRNA